MIWLSSTRLAAALIALDTDAMTDDATTVTEWVSMWSSFFEAAVRDVNSATPLSVTVVGSQLQIGINSLLGAGDASGTRVQVQHLSSGEVETAVSLYSPVNYVMTSFLGQSVPSTTLADYLVAVDPILTTSFSTAESAMASALSGITGYEIGAEKLRDGIAAWWTEITTNPSNFFTGASAVTAPSGITGLKSALEATFLANVQHLPPYTEKTVPVGLVADDIISAITGGKVTVSMVEYDIE